MPSGTVADILFLEPLGGFLELLRGPSWGHSAAFGARLGVSWGLLWSLLWGIGEFVGAIVEGIDQY